MYALYILISIFIHLSIHKFNIFIYIKLVYSVNIFYLHYRTFLTNNFPIIFSFLGYLCPLLCQQSKISASWQWLSSNPLVTLKRREDRKEGRKGRRRDRERRSLGWRDRDSYFGNIYTDSGHPTGQVTKYLKAETISFNLVAYRI